MYMKIYVWYGWQIFTKQNKENQIQFDVRHFFVDPKENLMVNVHNTYQGEGRGLKH